jgi:cytochrome c-type biogenesis protein CcmH
MKKIISTIPTDLTTLTASILISVLLLLILPLPVNGLVLADLEDDIICACSCYRLLSNCDCEVAEQMKMQIREMIDKGMSKREIISNLQSIYGKEILATPPKEGIFTGLWIYPTIVVSAGVIFIGFLLKRRDSRWYGDPDETINKEHPEWVDESFDETVSER